MVAAPFSTSGGERVNQDCPDLDRIKGELRLAFFICSENGFLRRSDHGFYFAAQALATQPITVEGDLGGFCVCTCRGLAAMTVSCIRVCRSSLHWRQQA